jgi:hypothetical protein
MNLKHLPLNSLRRADHSSRRVLPTLVLLCVWSRNLKNGEAIAHWGGLLHQKQKTNQYLPLNLFLWPVLATDWNILKGSFVETKYQMKETILRTLKQLHQNTYEYNFKRQTFRKTFIIFVSDCKRNKSHLTSRPIWQIGQKVCRSDKCKFCWAFTICPQYRIF